MGLFGSSHKNTKETDTHEKEDEFKSVIIDTEHVVDELKNLSAVYNISPRDLSFKILKILTSYKIEKNEDYKEVTGEDFEIFHDNDFLLNPELKIKQHFKVEIFKKPKKELHALPEIVLGGNKSLTKIIATAKQNFEIRYYEGLEEKIIEDINIKKIRSNILVGIRDEAMHREVKKLVAMIRVKNLLENDFVFVVCQGVEKVDSIDDKLLFHYKNKLKPKDGNDRVDYARRGYVLAVSSGEPIIEYVKAQNGTPGRNCQGKFLSVTEATSQYDGNLNISENITKKEDDNKILYVANQSGYVNIDNGVYDIKDNMEIESVDFKSTGSIETDINSNVTINIKESDALKDAIGPGMSVETSELNIEGNIGSGATVKTKKLVVKGQTHKTSKLESEFANIAVHRGEVSGREIEIERLEGGMVFGDIVRIKSAIGGEVVAKEIYIDELTSNTTLRANSLIDISHVKGSNNKLCIDPTSTHVYHQKIEKINEDIKKTKIELVPMPKLLESKKRLIDNNRSIIEEIKNRISDLKKSNKRPPISLINKIKDYQKIVNEYNTLLNNFKNKKHQLASLNENLLSVQNQIFSAKIINRGIWKEFNELKFKLISPALEVIYNTKDNEIIREVTLVHTGDNQFEIKKSSEYSAS
ncbi:flagellar assembly protein A [Sulfurospirillum sp. 1612]|uniref:flagellar assembly protein A n=1 Tax=Sulfurospirillum sp. 1612 TaxID=3094835 RepID=UPI002F95D977